MKPKIFEKKIRDREDHVRTAVDTCEYTLISRSCTQIFYYYMIQTLTSIRGDLLKLLKSFLTFSFRSFKGLSAFFLKELDT